MPETFHIDTLISEIGGQRPGDEHRAAFLEDPPREELFCPIISVDDHAFEPHDVFTSRVEARFRDRVPRVVEEDSFPHWLINGELFPFTVADGSVGRPIGRSLAGPQRLEDYRAGVYNLTERVKDMDLCGIWASLCFPSFVWGFAGSRFLKMKDRQAAFAAFQAYNDWMLEQWCGSYPERFIPGQVAWLADPEVAAGEIRRNSERGFRCVSFIENPEPLGLPSIYSKVWDPFFAACAETETVINLHVGSSGLVARPSAESPTAVTTALFPMGGLLAAVDWVFARIPARFAGLKIALSEAGVSWVPMITERLRRASRFTTDKVADEDAEEAIIRQLRRETRISEEDLARYQRGEADVLEQFQTSFYFCSIEDPSAFQNLEEIGEDKVMVETDYPHGDTVWPSQQAMLRYEARGLEPRLVRKVCYENAAQLYRWSSPPADLVAASSAGSA
jgi:predicted TIM-barrel fold metal-dependent hydrolase